MSPRFTVEERADRLWVAGHDLWTHALWRGVIVPALTPFLRWLGRVLP